MGILLNFANSSQKNSLSNRLRKKRFQIFESFTSDMKGPIKILDVGGTQNFWDNMHYSRKADCQIYLLNLTKEHVHSNNYISVAGNAVNIKEFSDMEFDIIFSNSVIEHVGDFEQHKKMAREIMRLGKRYYLQTPNKMFPIEPHFLFPMFQFLPLTVKVFLLMHFNLGHGKKIRDKNEAINRANSIHLLTRKELRNLFPKAQLYEEKFGGLTKSFIVYGMQE